MYELYIFWKKKKIIQKIGEEKKEIKKIKKYTKKQRIIEIDFLDFRSNSDMRDRDSFVFAQIQVIPSHSLFEFVMRNERQKMLIRSMLTWCIRHITDRWTLWRKKNS